MVLDLENEGIDARDSEVSGTLSHCAPGDVISWQCSPMCSPRGEPHLMPALPVLCWRNRHSVIPPLLCLRILAQSVPPQAISFAHVCTHPL